MEQLNDYADARLLVGCIHCGGNTGTRDHMPSRILLDEPYPENLPVVPACPECNNGFSLDEEYLACLIECARTGSIDNVERPKIRRILSARPALAERLKQARTVSKDGAVSHICEEERIKSVLMKLARGHAAYELSKQLCGDPTHYAAIPLHILSPQARSNFEEIPSTSVIPEVGSRAMQRIALLADWGRNVDDGWVEVQPDRYRYSATSDGATVSVRIVVAEYLACEVIWNDE